MTWVKIDDGWPNNPKVEPLSKDAKLLYVCGLCYCGRNLTDGVLNAKAVKVVLLEAAAKPRHVVELHEAGLWDRLSDGYLVHDFLKYNPSRAQTAERREEISAARSEAGKRGAAARWHGKTDGKSDGKPGMAPSRPVEDQKTLGELGLFRVPTAALSEAGAA